MKKNRYILTLIAALLLLPNLTNAQLVKIGAGGGLTQVLAPDALTKEVSDGGLGYSTEWNSGAMVKVEIPLFPLIPRGYFLYHSLSGNGEADPNLWQDPNVEFTQSILEIGAGVQYNFIPLPAGFDPYIALDLGYTNFGKLSANDSEDIPFNESKSRFGGGIGLGTEVTIIPLINLDFYLSYKMLNLTGKEDGEETISAVTLDAFIIFNFL
jgi:hypothetical protein